MENPLLNRGREIMKKPMTDEALAAELSKQDGNGSGLLILDTGTDADLVNALKAEKGLKQPIQTVAPISVESIVPDPNLTTKNMDNLSDEPDIERGPAAAPEANPVIQLWVNNDEYGITIDNILYKISKPVYDLVVRIIKRIQHAENQLSIQIENMNIFKRTLHDQQQ